jgi:hypothetical protein
MTDGTVVSEEIAVADAHPAGAHPFTRGQYAAKFRTLANGVIAAEVQDRFLEAVTRLADLDADELAALALPGIEQAGDGCQFRLLSTPLRNSLIAARGEHRITSDTLSISATGDDRDGRRRI